jgi:hypothetical protein
MSSDATDGSRTGPTGVTSWSASGWLQSLGVAQCVASALGAAFPPSEHASELEAVRAISKSISCEEELAAHLDAGDVVRKLAAALLPELRQISSAEAVTGDELHGKFVQEGKAFTLSYSDLSTFFGGLEAKIGPPSPVVMTAMEDEHTRSSDSHDQFTTGNYGVTTTSATEFAFVTDPERPPGGAWPVEMNLLDTAPEKMRRPMGLSTMEAALAKVNATLSGVGEPVLVIEEGVGARLCTSLSLLCPWLEPCSSSSQPCRRKRSEAESEGGRKRLHCSASPSRCTLSVLTLSH